jgi:hypothetical protein
MRSNIFRPSLANAFKALVFIAGTTILQGCFFGGGHPYYADPGPYYGPSSYGPPAAYAYAPRPAYGYAAPPRVGDYDEHHEWHDRDWWVQNNRPWVQQHHPTWMASHEHDGDHDRH